MDLILTEQQLIRYFGSDGHACPHCGAHSKVARGKLTFLMGDVLEMRAQCDACGWRFIDRYSLEAVVAAREGKNPDKPDDLTDVQTYYLGGAVYDLDGGEDTWITPTERISVSPAHD
jgi:hypothetical protein